MKQTARFDYNAIEVGYYDEVFQRRTGVQSKWHHLKFDHVRSRMGEYQDHLDIGCGPGTFVGTLNSNGTSMGVDIAVEQIAYAQQKYGTDQHQFRSIEPGKPLPFAAENFDVVTMIELIEHLTIEQSQFLIQEAKRVLKSGGRIILTTPNYASLWPVLEWGVNRFSPVSYEDQHIVHYTKPRLRKLLQDRGWGDIKVKVFQGMAPFAAVFHWNFADTMNKIESGAARLLGYLLIAEARKP